MTQAETLQDLLLLVDCRVPIADIRKWNGRQWSAAEKWAAKTHLRASDNNVRVPQMPEFLLQYRFSEEILNDGGRG